MYISSLSLHSCKYCGGGCGVYQGTQIFPVVALFNFRSSKTIAYTLLWLWLTTVFGKQTMSSYIQIKCLIVCPFRNFFYIFLVVLNYTYFCPSPPSLLLACSMSKDTLHYPTVDHTLYYTTCLWQPTGRTMGLEILHFGRATSMLLGELYVVVDNSGGI